MAELKKSLGTVRLTFYGVGTIVGAGIYTVIGAAAGQAGYDLWLSFIFAAVAASFSALSYAELSSTYPSAGAEFLFVRKAFPKIDLPSFLSGWTIAFHSSATIAGEFPAFMVKVNKQKVPWASSLVVLTAVAAFLLLGDIKVVAGMSSLGALLVFIAVNIALIVLRYKSPEQERPFKVPLSVGKLPVLPVLAILISTSLAVQYQWQVYAAFAGAIVAGIILDYFLDKRPRKELSQQEEKKLFKH